MKRITAWLMALCLIATCILPVRAMETNGTESPDVMQENEDPDNEAAGEEQKTVPEEGGDTFSNVSPLQGRRGRGRRSYGNRRNSRGR